MVAGFFRSDELGETGVGSDGLIIYAGDHVAFLNSCLLSCAFGSYFDHVYAVDIGVNAELFLLGVVETFGRHADAQIASLYGTIFHDVADDLFHEIGRNSIGIAGKGAGRRSDGGVDSDEFAVGVDQSAAAAAGVNG